MRSASPILQRYGFRVAPLQSSWLPSRTGLSTAELITEVRLLKENGELVSGAEVYRQIMRRIWWMFPGYLLSRVPGLREIFDWTYRTVARHRHTISRGCGLSAPAETAASAAPYPERNHGRGAL